MHAHESKRIKIKETLSVLKLKISGKRMNCSIKSTFGHLQLPILLRKFGKNLIFINFKQM